MKYYEDITTMHGDEAAAVDVIIGGSPCQDLSVAGQRAGLDGERSSLFLDQIRVIKEAHSKYGRNKPRYMVWENVPGALSSANGEDFRRVLEETAKVADETAVIPRPEKGKWTTAGCIMGDGYSIAWRILDAQFWGVPQRRRRIALVADFAGQSAPEILFKPESVSGHTAESREARQGTAGSAESGVGITNRGIYTGTISETLRAESHSALPTVCTDEPIGFIHNQGSRAGSVGAAYGIGPTLRAEVIPAICIQGNCIDRADTAGCNGRGWRDDDVAYTLNTIDRPAVYDARGNGNGETAPRITGDHQNRVTDYTAICCASSHAGYAEGIGTLRAAGGDLGGGSEMLVIKKDGEYNAGTQNKILRLLQSTYGTQALVEWEAAIMEALQRAEVLQQGMQDICDERQTKKRNELDDDSLPRAELVAGWLLRDMWLLQKHRCSSQRRESTEQRHIEFAETLPKLPLESSQNPQLLFDMWEKGERLWLLRETLSEIQEIRKPVCSIQKRSYNLVRRLTPLEAERLQGYPDEWTDIGEWTDSKGKKHQTTDSARYKALGNSIALPPWRFVCRRICEQYDTQPTMGSLFDGIGGFPLIWREINGADSVPWACEIDEYCRAVTQRRLP